MLTILRVVALAGACAQLASGGILPSLRVTDARSVDSSPRTATEMPFLEDEVSPDLLQDTKQCPVGKSCGPVEDCYVEGERKDTAYMNERKCLVFVFLSLGMH